MLSFFQNPKTKVISAICLILVFAILPFLKVPAVWFLYIFLFFIYLSLANMWNLLAGYSGLISLCQPAFIGLAGYTLVIITWSGLPFYWGIIAGGIVCGLFAFLISIPVFRLSGIYFAIGTLVVPEILRVIFLLWRPVGGELHGGGAGYRLKGVEGLDMTEIYWMALAIGVASIFIMRFILKSSLGLGLAAIRDNADTAASSGIHVFKLKLFSFVVGAIVTGIAGSIFFIYQKYIEPTSAFNIRWTMILMLSAVIGGLGVETGPIIGTIVVVFLHFFLAKYAGWSLLLQGIMLMIVMLLLPRGIMGFAIKKSE